MRQKTPLVLSITGSDSTGQSGIQSDIRAVQDLGGDALTAITALSTQNSLGLNDIIEIPTYLVIGQLRAIYKSYRPKAVKVGLMTNPETVKEIRNEIVGCPNIISSPVILSASGKQLASMQTVNAVNNYLLPITKLLVGKCCDVEIVLKTKIKTDDEMIVAAQKLCNMGAEWVMLRGSQHTKDRVTTLLYSADGNTCKFFTSYNIEGWQRHGVGGALSAAITTRIALGDNVLDATTNAHKYIHSQIVYATQNGNQKIRPYEIYNQFLSLIANNYCNAHDVGFYASRLSITTRYLSKITKDLIDKTPKQVIDEYLVSEARQLLRSVSLSVQEVSDMMGFSSQIVFTKFIKEKTGKTAKEIRK